MILINKFLSLLNIISCWILNYIMCTTKNYFNKKYFSYLENLPSGLLISINIARWRKWRKINVKNIQWKKWIRTIEHCQYQQLRKKYFIATVQRISNGLVFSASPFPPLCNSPMTFAQFLSNRWYEDVRVEVKHFAVILYIYKRKYLNVSSMFNFRHFFFSVTLVKTHGLHWMDRNFYNYQAVNDLWYNDRQYGNVPFVPIIRYSFHFRLNHDKSRNSFDRYVFVTVAVAYFVYN